MNCVLREPLPQARGGLFGDGHTGTIPKSRIQWQYRGNWTSFD